MDYAESLSRKIYCFEVLVIYNNDRMFELNRVSGFRTLTS